MSAVDQLALFEPQAGDLSRLAAGYRRDYLRCMRSVDLWHACLCPGLRDAAQAEADAALSSWLVCAIYLDLSRYVREIA